MPAVGAHGWVSEHFLSALQELGSVLSICFTRIILFNLLCTREGGRGSPLCTLTLSQVSPVRVVSSLQGVRKRRDAFALKLLGDETFYI